MVPFDLITCIKMDCYQGSRFNFFAPIEILLGNSIADFEISNPDNVKLALDEK